MLPTVLFDLDGTLLPLDQDAFIRSYLGLLTQTMAPYGYEPKSFADALLKSCYRAIENDGSRTNEALFWDSFASLLGDRILAHKEVLDAFYHKEFEKLKAICQNNPAAVALVRDLRAAGVTVALATNPVFPQVATYARIRWAGLTPEDFSYITTYENSHACKPSPAYYREVAERLGVAPADCLMVGNDALDDLVAEQVGMKVFLLTDHLLNRENKPIDAYPQGDFNALRAYLQPLLGW